MRCDKRLALLILALTPVLAVTAGCGRPKGSAAKAAAPAKIDNPVKETDLTTLTLTPEAVARLGIETAKAGIASVPRTLQAGGEIVARPGSRAVVAAPSAGVVLAPKDRTIPLAGAQGCPRPGRPPFLAPSRGQGPHRRPQRSRPSKRPSSRRPRRRPGGPLTSSRTRRRARRPSRRPRSSWPPPRRPRRPRGRAGRSSAPDRRWPPWTTCPPSPSFRPSKASSRGSASPRARRSRPGRLCSKWPTLDPVWVRVPVYVGDVASVDPRSAAAVRRVRPLGRNRDRQRLARPGPAPERCRGRIVRSLLRAPQPRRRAPHRPEGRRGAGHEGDRGRPWPCPRQRSSTTCRAGPGSTSAPRPRSSSARASTCATSSAASPSSAAA